MLRGIHLHPDPTYDAWRHAARAGSGIPTKTQPLDEHTQITLRCTPTDTTHAHIIADAYPPCHIPQPVYLRLRHDQAEPRHDQAEPRHRA